MLEHEKEIEEQNLKHSKSLQEEQTQNNKREQQLKNELEFLKASFHSYKVEFHFTIFFIRNLIFS